MSKFPDFDGFWEFPNDQNSVPKTGWKSQELGKFPTSANTEDIFLSIDEVSKGRLFNTAG